MNNDKNKDLKLMNGILKNEHDAYLVSCLYFISGQMW